MPPPLSRDFILDTIHTITPDATYIRREKTVPRSRPKSGESESRVHSNKTSQSKSINSSKAKETSKSEEVLKTRVSSAPGKRLQKMPALRDSKPAEQKEIVKTCVGSMQGRRLKV